jgi:hypothetical protein
MPKALVLTFLSLLVTITLACTIPVPTTDSLFPTGTPFILSGTAALADNQGPCLIWVGENGITYHLFQAVNLESDLFDTITTPGTTSRLQLATRSDLEVACRMGTVVEVQDVLEVFE